MVGEFLLAVGDGGLAGGVEAEDTLVAVAEAGEDGVEFLGGGCGVGCGVGRHCFFFFFGVGFWGGVGCDVVR